MQRIEVIGVTGVGKSTLVKALCRSKAEDGEPQFITPDDLVIDTYLLRSSSLRFRTLRKLFGAVDAILPDLPKGLLRRVYKFNAYEYAVWRWGREEAVVNETWPRFIDLISRGIQESTLPVSRFFVHWTLKAFSVAAIAEVSPDVDRVLLHDEGLAHRVSWFLSGGGDKNLAIEALEMFRPKALIYVGGDGETEFARLLKRMGRQGKAIDYDAVRYKQKLMADGMLQVRDVCPELGIPVIDINPREGISDQVRILRHQMRTSWPQ